MRKNSLDLDSIIVGPETQLAVALARLDSTGIGALAVCDGDRRLLALLTDGDIRRALLHSQPLTTPCLDVARAGPLAILQPVVPRQALALMNKHDINHLPVIDAQNRLLDLLRRNDLITEQDLAIHKLDRLQIASIPPTLSLGEAIARLDLAGTGALLLRDEQGTLCGLLTDGDVRRAVLKSVPMKTPCQDIAIHRPVTVPNTTSAADALHLMNERDINHLPVIDQSGKVVDFLLRKDLIGDLPTELSAVIMAGGFGKRLHPLTETTPKPMLPLGDRPVLERTLQQLCKAGICDVHITTHHLASHIIDHFGNGEAYGVKLRYTREDQPLGTAGSLKLVDHPSEPILVLNADIVTSVSFSDMLLFHRKHRAELTIGVRKYEMTVPFGVVECNDVHVCKFREKPTEVLFINAGIYLLERSAIDAIPDGVPFDMTDLIQTLLAQNRSVVNFPILEYWLDIGHHKDYLQAQDDLRNGRI